MIQPLRIVLPSWNFQEWLETAQAKSIQLEMEVLGYPGYFDQEVQEIELEHPDGAWDKVEYPEFFWWRELNGVKQEPPNSLSLMTIRCPRCYSTQVVIDYPYIKCEHCSYNETLIDYPL